MLVARGLSPPSSLAHCSIHYTQEGLGFVVDFFLLQLKLQPLRLHHLSKTTPTLGHKASQNG